VPVKDEKVVAFVDAFRERHGRDPSIRDIQVQFNGMPSSTAQRYRKQRGSDGGNVANIATLTMA
jgi:hypothetical protein